MGVYNGRETKGVTGFIQVGFVILQRPVSLTFNFLQLIVYSYSGILITLEPNLFDGKTFSGDPLLFTGTMNLCLALDTC